VDKLSLDVIVKRGDYVESLHRVHAVVVDSGGSIVMAAGDPELVCPWRSCAKPFQALPLVESGVLGELGWGAEELALACASHGGEPEHVAIVEHMLRSIGLEEGDLACGPHEPLSRRGARLLREAGAQPSRLHNNCSGKHAAMLARTRLAGWPIASYERLEHPVQQSCLSKVAEWTGIKRELVGCAIDGCGVVVFVIPLRNMAAAYARLVTAAAQRNGAAARVVSAMLAQPFLVGGTDRFDTVLMEESGGRILAKIGAEGIHSAAIPALGLGLALKVEDGASRAQYPALLALLQRLQELPDPLPRRLMEFASPTVRNTRGEVVGSIAVVER
jgi:L-asparaginase II